MRRLQVLLGLCGVLLVIGVGIVAAQDTTCPAVIEAAFEQTVNVCDGAGVVCYGNDAAEIALLMISSVSAPAAPGDVAPLNHVQSFRTLPFDADSGMYGVVLARRDLSGDDDVEFLFFGDVDVMVGADPVVGLDSFTFRSGLYDAPCDGAPDSGLLIHSPGTESAPMTINGVDIRLRGVAFIQAQPGVDIAVQVITGQAEVGYDESFVTIGDGQSARVALTDDFMPVGDVLIKNYDLVTTLAIPVAMLPEPVVVSDELPISGEWRTITDTCDLHEIGATHTVTISPDGRTLTNESAEYHLIAPGRYRYDYGTDAWWEARILSPTHIEFVNEVDCSTESELVTPAE